MTDTISIRLAGASDARPLMRLAALDSAPLPAGELLVAEQGGALRAAVTLDGADAIADPFIPTADLVALLRLRAHSLRATSGAGVTMPGRRLAHQLAPQR